MNANATSSCAKTRDFGRVLYNYLGQTNQIASRSVGAGASTITTTWGYDTNANDRRLKSISNSGVSRSYALGYAIPGGGGAQNPYNIQSIAETPTLTHPYTAKSWAFGYDLSDRLLSATTSAGGSFAYGYDKLDNVTSLVTSNGRNKNATYNALNQRQGLIWRPSGNLKNDGDHYLTWDGGNRLLSADYLAVGGGYTGQLTKFNYDGLGRRVIDVERDVGGLNPVETHQLWCGDNLCAQRTAADVPTKRFYPEGEHDLVTGKKYIYMPDHLGSVRDVLDATTGALVYTADYEPDGNEWREATLNGGSRPTFRYAGMHWHPALKKYLTRYRFYDQTMPFWTSRDPLGEAAGMNLYSYVNGNPANFMDPLGLARSPDWMRMLIPGQIAWDNARTSWEEDNYGQSIALTSQMLAEQALTVATLGEYGVGRQAMNAVGEAKQCLAQGAEKFFAQDSPLFKRRGGWLNNNDYFRIGWNWSGKWDTGSPVFRIAIGNRKSGIHWHWDLWK